MKLPAGYSAVVANPPLELGASVEDRLTRARYYPGTVVDTRTLVSGRCYIVVWSPKNQMGKYALQIGHQWPHDVGVLVAHAHFLVAHPRLVRPQPHEGIRRRRGSLGRGRRGHGMGNAPGQTPSQG